MAEPIFSPPGLSENQRLFWFTGTAMTRVATQTALALSQDRKVDARTALVMANGAVYFCALLAAWRNPDWLHMVCSRIVSSDCVGETENEWGEIFASLVQAGTTPEGLRVNTLEQAYELAAKRRVPARSVPREDDDHDPDRCGRCSANKASGKNPCSCGGTDDGGYGGHGHEFSDSCTCCRDVCGGSGVMR